MTDRISELLELSRAGDEDVSLQVESEIALMPDTRQTVLERAAAAADEYAEQFAPKKDAVPDDILAQMADEAGF